MYCKRCGKQIIDNTNYCGFCGRKIELNDFSVYEILYGKNKKNNEDIEGIANNDIEDSMENDIEDDEGISDRWDSEPAEEQENEFWEHPDSYDQ